jgi:hypothetical protein
MEARRMSRVATTFGPVPRPQKPLVSPALRQAARGMRCTLRWSLECDGGGDTTVLAHLRGPWCGIGQKPSDWFGVYACHACHDALDGRRGERVPPEEVVRALHETLASLFRDGLLAVTP